MNNVRQSSITCFHDRVKNSIAPSQNSKVMAAVVAGKDYSLSELMRLTTGIDKSSMSRTVNGLRAIKLLEPAPDRKCSVTGVTVTPSRIPEPQGSLFA